MAANVFDRQFMPTPNSFAVSEFSNNGLLQSILALGSGTGSDTQTRVKKQYELCPECSQTGQRPVLFRPPKLCG